MQRQSGAAIHSVSYRFSWDQAVHALEKAEAEDIAYGGIYDAHSVSAISIWSCPWTTAQSQDALDLIGTIYWEWGQLADESIEVFALQVGPNATLGAVKRQMKLLFGTPIHRSVAA